MIDAEAVARFIALVNVNGPTLQAELGPCHLWLGPKYQARGGYGRFGERRAHRVAFEIRTGHKPGPVRTTWRGASGRIYVGAQSAARAIAREEGRAL